MLEGANFSLITGPLAEPKGGLVIGGVSTLRRSIA
jgi:hypothetical protein